MLYISYANSSDTRKKYKLSGLADKKKSKGQKYTEHAGMVMHQQSRVHGMSMQSAKMFNFEQCKKAVLRCII